MKKMLVLVAALACGSSSAFGQAKVVTQDSVTALPVAPATVPNAGFGNPPTSMPPAAVCRSKMVGANFYLLFNIKTSAAVAWYAAHLTGFTKVEGYDGGRAQAAFSNADHTLLVIVTGNPAARGQDADAYSVAYEKYTPGLAAKTVASLTQGKIACQ